MMKNKRLLILGGSRISCQIVKKAQSMGIIVGVTDWYKLEQSPAKQIADEAYYVSTSDVDAVVQLIKDNAFDGVITGFTDSVLPYYAQICEKAGIPAYGTKEQFETFINKNRYKELLRTFDIPTIKEYKINLSHFENSIQSIKYPVLVKPADSSGSRGITICHNSNELKEAIAYAMESSEEKELLVEQYVDEDEVTIFWLFVDGNYYMTLLGNRHVKYNQEGAIPLPVGYTYPSGVQVRYIEEVEPKVKAMLEHVGIKNGMMFMQCKVIEGVCVVYDVGYRLTGSFEYINLRELCGFDPMDMLIKYALTGSMGEPAIERKVDPYLGGKYSFNVSLLAKPGRIAQINGIEEVKSMKNVFDVIVAHPVGDVITEQMMGLLSQITVRILGYADSVDELKSIMMTIHDTMEVVSETGENMLLPGIALEDEINVIG